MKSVFTDTKRQGGERHVLEKKELSVFAAYNLTLKVWKAAGGGGHHTNT